MKFNHLNLCVDDLTTARELFEYLFDFQCIEQKKDAIAVMTNRHGFTLVLSHLGEEPVCYPQGFHAGIHLSAPSSLN